MLGLASFALILPVFTLVCVVRLIVIIRDWGYLTPSQRVFWCISLALGALLCFFAYTGYFIPVMTDLVNGNAYKI